jgi:hypothetical protein
LLLYHGRLNFIVVLKPIRHFFEVSLRGNRKVRARSTKPDSENPLFQISGNDDLDGE